MLYNFNIIFVYYKVEKVNHFDLRDGVLSLTIEKRKK